MRLSMIDHEDHQKKFNDQAKANSASGNATPDSVSGGPSTTRSNNLAHKPEKKEGTTSRFLSSIKNRSRSGSNASNKSVSFSSMPAPPRTSGSSSPTSASPNTARSPAVTSNLNPSSASPVAPITTLADHTSADDFGPGSSGGNPGMLPGIPRISLDMPPMQPTPAKPAASHHWSSMTKGNETRCRSLRHMLDLIVRYELGITRIKARVKGGYRRCNIVQLSSGWDIEAGKTRKEVLGIGIIRMKLSINRHRP